MAGLKTLPGVVKAPCVTGTLLLLLALAGCGSTNKAATTTAAASAATPAAPTGGSAQAVKAATYNINLAHVAGSSGGASASGTVILSVKPPGELCWSISPVKNFTVSTSTTQATIVTIQRTASGTPSTPGIPLGTAYKSAGCVHEPPAFLGRLQANPQMFYLSIYNTQSGDAVRGQV
jgi:hypothetical protein